MKAGASGFTMVAAQFAFIMEPNLNPALEEQAVSRIHRIGQQKRAKVMKFVVPDTIEQRIVSIRERRQRDVTSKHVMAKSGAEVWDEETLMEMFDVKVEVLDNGKVLATRREVL